MLWERLADAVLLTVRRAGRASSAARPHPWRPNVVTVKFHPLLAKRATSRTETRTVAYRPGLTPLALLQDEGFSAVDAEAVMILRGDVQIEPETPIQDGDALEFMVGIQGG